MTARAPSSPPPPAVSPEHVTARVDSSEEEATRTPVHEPPVHGPSAHETSEEHTSGWDTCPDQPEEPSGHANDGGEPTDIEEEGHHLPAWLYTATRRAGDPRAKVVDFP